MGGIQRLQLRPQDEVLDKDLVRSLVARVDWDAEVDRTEFPAA